MSCISALFSLASLYFLIMIFFTAEYGLAVKIAVSIFIISTNLYTYALSMEKYQDKALRCRNEYENKKAELDKIEEKRQRTYQERCHLLQIREEKLRNLLRSEQPFKSSSEMIMQIETAIFDDCAKFLRYKRHPAAKAADEVRLLKKVSAEYIARFHEMEYKYQYILSAFPEIQEYVDNDSSLIEVGQQFSYEDIKEQRDRSRDYLSDEEWNSLTTTERNQLALDRYISRQKSPWQIGRDYELCCAFTLERQGWKVIRNGIKNGVHDLGRDLIAIKNISGMNHYLVIQCKCWNNKKEIRENVVFQLYGTSIAFEMEMNQDLIRSQSFITCVLMIPPFTKLSKVADAFCKRLNIKLWEVDFNNFPRIKCNINGNDKIYHLPFDQQYDRTEIKNAGEFFAYTVAEAESKGFRRALRHYL